VPQSPIDFVKRYNFGRISWPVLSPSSFEDAWELSAKAVEIAVKFRTPVFFIDLKRNGDGIQKCNEVENPPGKPPMEKIQAVKKPRKIQRKNNPAPYKSQEVKSYGYRPLGEPSGR